VKDVWYCITAPLEIGKLKTGGSLDGQGYPTFRAARKALIEALQRDIRIYQKWIADAKRQVHEVAHWEEPS
jgi:hypothetical protein